MRASPLWSALVRAGRVLRWRVLEYWGTGVLGYWRTGVLVRVGVAGPGRRPSPRQSALVCSRARWSGAALSVLEYWGTGVLRNWRTGVLVRVGVAGPGRRPSPRQSALVCSGARWSGAALLERGQWGSPRNRTVPKSGARWGSGSGPAPQSAPVCAIPLWSAAVRCCVVGSWSAGVLEYWSTGVLEGCALG